MFGHLLMMVLAETQNAPQLAYLFRRILECVMKLYSPSTLPILVDTGKHVGVILKLFSDFFGNLTHHITPALLLAS